MRTHIKSTSNGTPMLTKMIMIIIIQSYPGGTLPFFLAEFVIMTIGSLEPCRSLSPESVLGYCLVCAFTKKSDEYITTR